MTTKRMEDNPVARPVSDLIDCVKNTIGKSQSRMPRAICFDFFDTLVFRIVPPENTKKIAAKQLSFLLDGISGNALYEIRHELERSLGTLNLEKGRDLEFELTELAGAFFNILRNIYPKLPLFSNEARFKRLFCNIEIAVEKQVQCIYKEMVELLHYLKNNSIPACLISDFYIPKKYFDLLLSHHGLNELFEKVYISADHGLTKGSGKLYTKVINDLGCLPEDLWMIGDNQHADKYMAEQMGIVSYLVDASETMKSYNDILVAEDSEIGVNKNVSAREWNRVVSKKRNICFPEMGSTLWLFISRLFDRLYQNQIEDVFFCSKEGEFLKHLFDIYQEKMFGEKLIISHYLIVSRKSTFICSLQPLEFEKFSRLFEQYRDITLEEFVLSLNFSTSEVEKLKKEIKCDWSARIQNLQQHNTFRKLTELPLFRGMYERQRISQKSNFLLYLDSFGVDFKKNGFHMVDIGWKGSIQNNIYSALDKTVHVNGYYLGLLSPTAVEEKNTKTGVLFCDTPELTPFIHVYNNNRSLFEMMLGASHGSADGYFKEQQFDLVKSQRNSTVYGRVGKDQNLLITVLDLKEERRLFKDEILPIQNSYLNIFNELNEISVQKCTSPPDPEWFAKQHARMLFAPTKAEVEFFSSLYHLENFGIFEFTSFDSNEKVPFKQRIRNLKDLYKNPAAILETGVWPPIILKRLGLEVLQPIDGMKRYKRIFGGGKG